ncbi:MAG TPA: hypothetical protein VN375_10625 [Vicinamibacteria bacterium]|jgi:hypothetical protein|nr:hypothetical protein [Vicinamibacteria bacterium]
MLKNPASLRAGEVELREIVAEDPSCPDAWLALGGFYKDRGLDVRAASMFQKVLEIRPGNPRATAELRAFSGAEGASRRSSTPGWPGSASLLFSGVLRVASPCSVTADRPFCSDPLRPGQGVA